MNEHKREHSFQTEWVWKSNSDKKMALIDLSGCNVWFNPEGNFGTSIVYGNKPMSGGQYFWEVKFTRSLSGTDTMVGVGTSSALQMNFENSYVSALGSDSQSWGLSYWGDLWHNGKVHKEGDEYGQFRAGDVIGLHLDLWNGTLAYYVDGEYLGIAFDNLQGKTLYPMVCAPTADICLRLLFTQSSSFHLFFLSLAALRKHVHPELDVLISALNLPPGLKQTIERKVASFLPGLQERPKCPLHRSISVSNPSNQNQLTRETNSCNHYCLTLDPEIWPWRKRWTPPRDFRFHNTDDKTSVRNVGSVSIGLVRCQRTDQDVRNMIASSSSRSSISSNVASNSLPAAGIRLLPVVKLVRCTSSKLYKKNKVASGDACSPAAIGTDVSTSCGNNKRKADDASTSLSETDDGTESSANKTVRYDLAGSDGSHELSNASNDSKSVLATNNVQSSSHEAERCESVKPNITNESSLNVSSNDNKTVERDSVSDDDSSEN